jgi:hypothetical protein
VGIQALLPLKLLHKSVLLMGPFHLREQGPVWANSLLPCQWTEQAYRWIFSGCEVGLPLGRRAV